MKITMRGKASHKKPKVLINADVLFELATRHEDSTTAVHTLFTQLTTNEVDAYASPISIAALFSLLRRCMGEQQAREQLNAVHSILTVAETDSLIIDLSLASRFDKFDDAIQYYTAIRHDISTVISRSQPDHSYHHLEIISPEQFVQTSTNQSEEDIWTITRKQLEQARAVH